VNRRARARARAIALGVALACAAAAACTAFDDVPLPGRPSVEAGTPDRVAPLEGGVDGAAPVVLPAPGFVSLAEAVQACTVIAACPNLAQWLTRSLRVAVAEAVPPTAEDFPPFDTNFSYCVEQLSKTFEPERVGREMVSTAIRKIAAATSCPDASRNIYFERFPARHPSCPADAGGSPWVCADDVTGVQCADTFSLLLHCAAPRALPSGKCVTLDAGPYGIGGCFLDNTECHPGCVGSSATLCDTHNLTGREYGIQIDCHVLGLECVLDPGTTNVGCAVAGHAARYDVHRYPGSYCENTSLVSSNGTFLGVLDCASFGGKCVTKNAAAVCSMPDAACSPFSPEANACQGSKIHLCVGGQWEDVQCPLGCEAPDGSPARAACRAAFDGDGG
jgi:hypothetical protein